MPPGGRRDASPPTAERSVSAASSRPTYSAKGSGSQLPNQRITGSNWGNRQSAAPGSSRRSYRQSNMRHTTSSRPGEPSGDPFMPLKVIDDQGINRTPKPLVAIVTSAALRQARGLGMQESMLGSETSEAVLGELSSTTFSRAWFDSGGLTPQEASATELDYTSSGRLMVPSNATVGDLNPSRMLQGSGSGKSTDAHSSPSCSQRPTRTPPDAAAVAAAAQAATHAVVLSEDDLAASHNVLLQETETIVMWDQPGLVVAVESAEGGQVVAANSRYAAQLAGRDTSDKYSVSFSQTPVVLLKHHEVQSGTSDTEATACQATAYDIHDSYAALEQERNADAEEQLGSVLPSGGAVAANGYQGSNQTSFARKSAQQFGHSNMSSVRSSAVGGWNDRRTTALDSTWSRPTSSRYSGLDKSRGTSNAGNAAAVALLAGEESMPDAWTQLPGLADVLAVMEAAVSQNIFLPQLMLFRDIKPPPPAPYSEAGPTVDCLSSAPSLNAGQLSIVPPTPMSRPSVCSTPGSGRPTDDFTGSCHTPHSPSAMGHGMLAGSPSMSISGMRPSVSGCASGSGTGPGGRTSNQLPVGRGFTASSRQSSIRSMSSSRVFRSNRPPAGLQLLWTWSCSLTEGKPITSIAWNTANTNLVAAGYSPRDAAPSAAGSTSSQPGPGAGPGAAGGASGPGPGSLGFTGLQGHDGAVGGQGGLLPSPVLKGDSGAEAAAAGSGAAAAEAGAEADSGGGCVALWSMKNQFYPVWSFKTKAGVTSLDFSQRNPHILGVGMHDGTIAVYDVRSRQPTPLLASTTETGKHSDPVWKVRWVDPGPEREEQLVSISTDGKIKAWTITKGLEHTTLTTLKRVPHRLVSASSSRGSSAGGVGSGGLMAGAGGAEGAAAAGPAGALPAGSGAKAAATVAALRADVSGARDARISRNTGGMSFDFSSIDRRMYLAGTEDGHIHKCSTSYSEQYLETYHGHIGPVYAVQWSPFNPSLFISCSGDWSIRMWQEGRQQQLMSFQSSNKEVLDVAWCPSNSTVFGAVTADGRLELWDFAVSTLRPVVQHAVTKCSMTVLEFAKDAPVVVAATDAGGLLVFRLVNIAAERFEPPELQHGRLEEALRANVMKAALAGS